MSLIIIQHVTFYFVSNLIYCFYIERLIRTQYFVQFHFHQIKALLFDNLTIWTNTTTTDTIAYRNIKILITESSKLYTLILYQYKVFLNKFYFKTEKNCVLFHKSDDFSTLFLRFTFATSYFFEIYYFNIV